MAIWQEWRKFMKIGTKSLLFGIHCFFLHPLFVAVAWWKLYGFPWDIRLWVAFIVHDWGYWGKPNTDGEEGEEHPLLGARIMQTLFDRMFRWPESVTGYSKLTFSPWYQFTLYHSRHYAKKHIARYSRLCVADKLAGALTPIWYFLFFGNLSGELQEYMQGKGGRTPAAGRTQTQWIVEVRAYLKAWAYEHKDLKKDEWTATDREKLLRTK